MAGSGNGSANPALKAKMMSYFSGKDAGRAILAQRLRTLRDYADGVDNISKGKNLSGKTFKGTISGMPGNMTGSW